MLRNDYVALVQYQDDVGVQKIIKAVQKLKNFLFYMKVNALYAFKHNLKGTKTRRNYCTVLLLCRSSSISVFIQQNATVRTQAITTTWWKFACFLVIERPHFWEGKDIF